MNDVLPEISRLSRLLQTSDLDLSALHGLVLAATQYLQQLVDKPGMCLTKLDSDLDSSLASLGISYSTESKGKFQRSIQNPFVTALIGNINDRLPDTGVFASFNVLDPKKLPTTVDEACINHYGEEHIQLLGDQYMTVVDKEQLQREWQNLPIYMINECSSETAQECYRSYQVLILLWLWLIPTLLF